MNSHTPEHITDGTPCWCNPRVEHTSGSDVIIHRSWEEIRKQRDELLLQCIMLLGMIEGRALSGGITLDEEDLAALKTTRRAIADAQGQQAIAKAEQQ